MKQAIRRTLLGMALIAGTAVVIQAKCTEGGYVQSCVGGHIWCCQDRSQCATVNEQGVIQTVYSTQPDASKTGEQITPSPLMTAQRNCGNGEGII